MKKSLITLFLFLYLTPFSLQGTKTVVKDLFEDYDGEIYSGYLQTKISGNELFYIYTPAQNQSSSNIPTVLWLNGGPGCSSLFGMLGEVGPVTADNYAGVFKKNPYSWNLNTNVVFIEQPAGVGFSKYSDPHFNWNDDLTAENLLAGVKDFLNTFPEIKSNPFYVSGESYAGVYIPYFATYALEDTASDRINLQGILVGNGLADLRYDVEQSMVEFGYWHAVIPTELYEKYKRNCPSLPDELRPWENSSNVELEDSFVPRNVTKKCNDIRAEIRSCFNGNDIYGLYRLCPQYDYSEQSKNDPYFYLYQKYSMRNVFKKTLFNYRHKYFKTEQYVEEDDIWPDIGCMDDSTVDRFLSLNTTKEKLNVFNKDQIWTQCAGINYEISDSIKFYKETMLKYSYMKVWVFSGTEDIAVGTLGTLRWIDKLNYNVETEWRSWKVDGQIAGYVQKYKEGIVFVSVKGAGHMVPQDKRAAAYKMFTAFINGQLPE